MAGVLTLGRETLAMQNPGPSGIPLRPLGVCVAFLRQSRTKNPPPKSTVGPAFYIGKHLTLVASCLSCAPRDLEQTVSEWVLGRGR